MACRNQNSGPVTRKRRKFDTQNVKDQEQLQKWIQPVDVIGPNDIILNPTLGKVKVEQEEWDVKPEVSLQVSGETLEDDIDLEEGVLVVKEEVATQLDTSEENVVRVHVNENLEKHLVASEDTMGVVVEDGNDKIQNTQQNEDSEELLLVNEEVIDLEEGVLVVKVEENDNEIQNGQEGNKQFSVNSKRIEKILEENRLLRTKLEEKETTALELEELLYEKKTERKTLQNKVHVLKETDSSQQEKIKTLHKIIAELEVEGEKNEEVQNEEVQTLNEVQNLPSTNSVSEVAKILALFPEIIKLLYKKELSGKNDKKKLLRRAEFLNCRLVCSAWRDAIDEINAGPCQALQKELTVFYDNYKSWRYGKFKVKHDVNNGLKKGRRVRPNKLVLPGRDWHQIKFGPTETFCENRMPKTVPQFNLSIVYSDLGQEIKEIEIVKVNKLLAKVGQTVKEFTFYVDVNELMLRFISFLRFMPNLTKVRYEGFDDLRRIAIAGNYTSSCNTNKPEKLTKFPHLPKLKRLSDLPDGLFEPALVANPQLQNLARTNITGFEDLIPENLKELTLYRPPSLDKLSRLKLPFLERLTLRNDIEKTESKFTDRRGTLFDSLKILKLPFNIENCPVFPKMLHLHTLIVNFSSTEACNQEERIIEFVDQFTSIENLILKGFVCCNCKTNICENKNRRPLETSMRYKKMKTKLVMTLWTTLSYLKKVEISLPTETRRVKQFEFVFHRQFDRD